MLNKGQRAINRHSPYERGDSNTRRLVNAWESAHARFVVGLVKGGDRPHNVGARSRVGLIASFLTSCTDGPKAAAMGPSCTGNWQLKGTQVENERSTSSRHQLTRLSTSLSSPEDGSPIAFTPGWRHASSHCSLAPAAGWRTGQQDTRALSAHWSRRS